ncbi:zinc finger-containing ubiquitin peptidase 1, partial [Tremellales sp. Uapishka_1]
MAGRACPVCSEVVEADDDAYNHHVNAHFDEVTTDALVGEHQIVSLEDELMEPEPDSLSCFVCGYPLDLLNPAQRDSHVNSCLDGSSRQGGEAGDSPIGLGENPMFGGQKAADGWVEVGWDGPAEPNEWLQRKVDKGDLWWDPIRGPPVASSMPTNVSPGVMSVLKSILDASVQRRVSKSAVLCRDVVHIKGAFMFDNVWGCGYRNALMAISSLLMHKPTYRPVFSKEKNGAEPGVRRIQGWMEEAWAEGYDADGREHFKGKILGTRKWIGTADLHAMFSFKGIPCNLYDFGKTKSPSGKVETHKTLQNWVKKYFDADPMFHSVSASAVDVIMRTNEDGSGRGEVVRQSSRYPLMLQHSGHSRTIVGYEENARGDINLLLFDPGRTMPKDIRSEGIERTRGSRQMMFPCKNSVPAESRPKLGAVPFSPPYTNGRDPSELREIPRQKRPASSSSSSEEGLRSYPVKVDDDEAMDSGGWVRKKSNLMGKFGKGKGKTSGGAAEWESQPVKALGYFRANLGSLKHAEYQVLAFTGGDILTEEEKEKRKKASSTQVNPATLLRRRQASAPFITLSLARNASTNSVFSFFSRSKPQPLVPASSSKDVFRAAVQSANISQLISAYNSLGSRELSAAELTTAMQVLSETSSGSGLPLLGRLYADYERQGYVPSGRHHRMMFYGLVNGGKSREALSFGKLHVGEMEAREWRNLLKGINPDDRELVGETVEWMKELDVMSQSCYGVLLRNIWKRPYGDLERRRENTERILAEVDSRGLALKIRSQTDLVRVYLGLKQLDKAEEISRKWDKEENRDVKAMWNTLIAVEIEKRDDHGVEKLCEEMRRNDMIPPAVALDYFIERSLNTASSSRMERREIISLVGSAEKKVGMEAGVESWARVVKWVLEGGGQSGNNTLAMEVYDEVRGRGLVVDNDFAKPLIKRLCSAVPADLNTAMDVYTDLAANTTPSLSIYHLLLTACARSSTSRTNTAPAIRLLNDMRERGLAFTSTVVTSLVIVSMKSSASYEDAFNVYAHFYALNKTALDEAGYDAILTAYLALAFPVSASASASAIPPANLILEIMKDMRNSGFHPGPRILTSLLSLYGNLALQPAALPLYDYIYRDSRLVGILGCIRHIHTIIKLDPNVEVDIPLLNALMNAYQKTGAFVEAFEVWDELVERRPREAESGKEAYGPSINIVLDACGYSDSFARAAKAWKWANRWALVRSNENWQAWLECLCRLGRMEMAWEELGEMKRTGREVGRKEVGILWKFSWRNKEFQWIREEVKKEYPEMWAMLERAPPEKKTK